ncbi:MAG: hypothetical protein LBD46_06565 [Endomicrobium sp.]|jgi:hypothetical protein|nr:hypothetical protein [Endomicrobium sp.]
MKILNATAENGEVSADAGKVPNAQILSAGKAKSAGILLISEEDKIYIAIAIDSMGKIIDSLISMTDTIANGQWTGSGTVAPSPALVTQLGQLKTELNQLKENLQ